MIKPRIFPSIFLFLVNTLIVEAKRYGSPGQSSTASGCKFDDPDCKDLSGTSGIIIIVCAIVGVMVILALALAFVPLYWNSSIGCCVSKINLVEGPDKQYLTIAKHMEEEWQAKKNETTSGDDGGVEKPQLSGTFEGCSRLTFLRNGCEKKETLELNFNSDGTVSGTRHAGNARTFIAGRWLSETNTIAWLETPKKLVANGIFVKKNGKVFMKGDFFASDRDFGKFRYVCADPNPSAATGMTQP